MKESNKLIIWGNYYSFFVMGMIVISFGSIMPYIREEFSLSYEKGGLILAFLSGSYLVNGLFSGVLVDRIGKKIVLVTGNLHYVIGLSLLFFASKSWMIYASVIVIGIGWGFCNTVINILVNDSSQGDGKAMSLLHMSFGIGAFFVPLLFNVFLKLSLNWQDMMLFLSSLALISFILSLNMKIPFIKEDHKKSAVKSFGNPKKLLIYMAILFFYVGGENAFSSWIVSYLMTAVHMAEGFSQNMLSTLWLSIIVGRYFVGVFNSRISKSKYVMIASSLSFVGMAVFISTQSQILIFLSVVCIGLSFAGVYPLTMAHANSIVRGSGLATAIIISGGGLGSTIIPYLSGRIADRFGTIAIITTILITIICMIVFSSINYFKDKKSSVIY